jgi:putative transposase
VFRKLAEQRERIQEGHLLADHVLMMISIPPKYAVSQVIGSGIQRREAELRGPALLGQGYFVSTVG